MGNTLFTSAIRGDMQGRNMLIAYGSAGRVPILPCGWSGATLAANKEVVELRLKSSLSQMEIPVDLIVEGHAEVEGRQRIHEAVPTEDRMQAFLWRHLLPAEDLSVLVYDPSYKPPVDRIRPLIRDEDRPKNVKPDLGKKSADGYLRQIESLYQEWLLTDEFANNQIAKVEARLIK